jgi:hypothetical protein
VKPLSLLLGKYENYGIGGRWNKELNGGGQEDE